MGHTDEPKMDELKRLLRRLDGLDGSKGITKSAKSEEEQRGYVGALRGAPVPDAAPGVPHLIPSEAKSSSSAVFAAAAAAAAISTLAVYFVMSWQAPLGNQGAGPVPSSAPPVVPSRLDYTPPAPSAPAGRQSDTADALVRRAEMLMQAGEIATARALLEEAATLGSGSAALKLGRSYDPKLATSLRYADSQTNPDLAKAWYERALALGTEEAAGYISDPGAR